MPHVTVNTYANLREFTGGNPSVRWEIVSGTTVRQLLEQMEIPPEQAKIVFIDHHAASLEQPLQGEERLDLFSAIGGG